MLYVATQLGICVRTVDDDSALGDEPILLTNRPQAHMQGTGDTIESFDTMKIIVESPMVDNDTLNSLIDIELHNLVDGWWTCFGAN